MYNTIIHEKYTFYNKITGEIILTGRLSQESVNKRLERDPNLGVILGNFSNSTHYINTNTGEIQEYTDEQKLNKSKTPTPFFFGKWSNEIMSWIPDTDTTALEASIKAERNRLLTESDWTDTLSAKNRLGEELYNSWQTYRQQLRDITSQPGYPQQVVWPQAPQ